MYIDARGKSSTISNIFRKSRLKFAAPQSPTHLNNGSYHDKLRDNNWQSRVRVKEGVGYTCFARPLLLSEGLSSGCGRDKPPQSFVFCFFWWLLEAPEDPAMVNRLVCVKQQPAPRGFEVIIFSKLCPPPLENAPGRLFTQNVWITPLRRVSKPMQSHAPTQGPTIPGHGQLLGALPLQVEHALAS